jgi:hypothetical protein
MVYAKPQTKLPSWQRLRSTALLGNIQENGGTCTSTANWREQKQPAGLERN